MHYLDNAATTRVLPEAAEAAVHAMCEEFGNPSSLHTIGQEAAVVLQKAREQIAVCLDADPKEIYFTSGGSEADNQALRSAAAIGKRKGHMHIISTAFEHHAILHTLEQLKAEGFSVTLLDDSHETKRGIRVGDSVDQLWEWYLEQQLDGMVTRNGKEESKQNQDKQQFALIPYVLSYTQDGGLLTSITISAPE